MSALQSMGMGVQGLERMGGIRVELICLMGVHQLSQWVNAVGGVMWYLCWGEFGDTLGSVYTE